jgi:endonuclease/exonuclease/phosphatase family metal-dependent hydrolase
MSRTSEPSCLVYPAWFALSSLAMKILAALLFLAADLAAASFTAATYNLEFYVDAPVLGRAPKAEPARRAIREAIRAMNADVIALQEMGSTNALAELRASLERDGMNYPYWEHARGFDSDLHLAFLSKLPITARRSHANESYLLGGRRFRVARGFAEIEVTVNDRTRVTLLTAHLKSKRQTPEADQREMREEEALLLREKVDEFFKRRPNGNLVVLGDFNDGITSRSTRSIMGRGQTKLFDARPREMPGAARERAIVWTHFYAAEETYSRIDYILTSPSMRRFFRADKSGVLARPDWGVASDHRPLYAAFELN